MKRHMDNCLVSVVVCTYNRAPYIGKTLNSLLNQSLSRDLYEIIVVDNASKDNTSTVVKTFHDNKVRYIYEARQGLSYSRNTGFEQARGDIIAYIDDDALACREWLERILKAFSLDEKIVAVGGKVSPLWEIEKPSWITPNLYTYFSCIDWSKKPYYLKKGAYLFGCNMSFKKNILVDCGGFTTSLGRIGNNLLSNDEWELFKCIDKKELKKYYDPEISVQHTVLPSRISRKWLKSRLYWQGVSNLYYDYIIEKYSKPQLLKKYLKEMRSFFSRELKKFMQGKGDKVLIRLFITRYIGTSIHFLKICLGLVKR
jgi:glycosyltransferase involved in cell wall biosynthesis